MILGGFNWKTVTLQPWINGANLMSERLHYQISSSPDELLLLRCSERISNQWDQHRTLKKLYIIARLDKAVDMGFKMYDKQRWASGEKAKIHNKYMTGLKIWDEKLFVWHFESLNISLISLIIWASSFFIQINTINDHIIPAGSAVMLYRGILTNFLLWNR